MTSSSSPLSKKQQAIAFIGAGNMNQSIATGLINQGYPQSKLWFSNPSPQKLDQLKSIYPDIHISQSNLAVSQAVDVIVLGVKPQKINGVCLELQQVDLRNKCIISVAAGVTLDGLASMLNRTDLSIIRSMPNTPAMIAQGATGLCANAQITDQQRTMAQTIFQAVGICEWLEDEALMDWVTAVSGSGPAHYFLFLEATIQAAIDAGMEPQTARNLASQTALGAAQMVQAQPDVEISTLRHNVTSPGGTTAAALQSYADSNVTQLIANALNASVSRGQELAELAQKASKPIPNNEK